MVVPKLRCLGFTAVAVIVLMVIAGCAAPIHEKRVGEVPVAPGSSGKSQNYRIGTQDILKLDVFQEEDMQTEQRVAQDGTINIPLAGRVTVGGLTVEEAGKAVEDKLRQGFLTNPQVTVHVLEYAPRRFSVFGQVNAPGAFEIPGEEVITLPTAIAMAQGNTRIGNLRRVLLTRKRDGEIYDITINLLSTEGRQFVVQKGDVIMVPESLF
jgi:protein involved in polysaccharide export with SLBB domain